MTTHPPSQIGRYRIERELGRGTMGVVYEAQDTTLGRTVALKTFGAMAVLAPHEREAFEQRFLSEARISATLDEPHVVGVYDVGRDFETGLLFMALEYVRGQTLAETLSRGPLPWEEAATIIAKVARALQAAHAHHIVHRDIKPANIMLTEAGEPKIMDFGIAKASASQLTVAGQVFGTPAYMSPEQASGEEVDGRSDIFSLGCVLYELVTNVRPFEGPTMAATLTKIIRDEPPPPSTVAKVPKAIDAIISRALRKHRDSRYDSAAHFAGDLERLLEGQPPTYASETAPPDTVDLAKNPEAAAVSRRFAPTARPKVTPPSHAPEMLELVEDAEKKPKGALIGGAVAALLVVGAFGFLALRSRTDPPKAVEAPSTAAAPVQAPVPVATAVAPTPASVPGNDVPTAAPTAAVLSVQGLGAPAKISFELRYPFGSGSLRVKLDDRVVLSQSLHGMPIRSGGVTSGFDGRFGTDLSIPAGDHVIQVEVRSGDTSFVESSRVQLRAGESRRLVAIVDKALTFTLQ